jgi:hypothetical protein
LLHNEHFGSPKGASTPVKAFMTNSAWQGGTSGPKRENDSYSPVNQNQRRGECTLLPRVLPATRMGYSDNALVCAASAPQAAQASLICSSPLATSIARTRMSFWQEGQIQMGGGDDGSGWRGRGMTAAVPAYDQVSLYRAHKRGQSFISARAWNFARSRGLCTFAPNYETCGSTNYETCGSRRHQGPSDPPRPLIVSTMFPKRSTIMPRPGRRSR